MTVISPKEHCKLIQMLDPDAYASGFNFASGGGSNEVDTQGFRFARIVVMCGDITSGAFGLQVQASDTTGSGFADVTGALFSLASSSDNTIFSGIIDLYSSEVTTGRFLHLSGSDITGTNSDMAVACELFNPFNTTRDLTLGGAAGVGDEPDFEIN